MRLKSKLKQRRTQIKLILVAFIIATGVYHKSITDMYKLTYENHGWTVTGILESRDVIRMPKYIYFMPVKSAGIRFYADGNINELYIGENIENMYYIAGSKTNLGKVYLPHKIDVIKENIFYHNPKIEELHLEYVKKIEDSAFYDTYINHVYFGDDLEEIGERAFMSSGIEAIELPDGIDVIKDSTFFMCRELKEVILPSHLKRIEDYAFLGCYQLKEMVLPEGLEYIGEHALDFKIDEGYAVQTYEPVMKELEIPASVKEIEENAFAYEMTLIVTEGSYAEEYVKEQGYTYRLK